MPAYITATEYSIKLSLKDWITQEELALVTMEMLVNDVI